MAAAIGLIGVVLGAMLAPVVEWVWQSQRERAERRRQLLEAVADFVSASGDALVAEWNTEDDKDAYDLWKQAEQDLIDAARAQLGAS